METKDFIIELEKKDMKLWLNEEGGLAFKGPKNFMTDDLLNQIKERKEEIVECLKRERFIKHDEKGKYLQFPLNDMQSAYYSGMKRIYELGGTSCYTYLELEVPQIDVLKLEQAWHQVIAKHDMLRAIVSKDGMQQILEKVLLPRLDVYDEDSLEEVRSDMEKLNFDIEKGPNHILKITKMKQGYIIHFAIDMLIADFVSINIILNDLFKAYKLGFLEINPKEVNFRDIVMDRIEKKEKIKSTTKYLKGKEYWLNKIDKMPDRPLLPIIQSKDENEDASFKRYEFEIDKNIWDNIKLISGRKGLTASNAVLGAFSEIIKKWSSNEEFVLSITLMDRQDKEMNIVGDFTAVDLLTVRKQSGTFLEKIKELQKELLMDLEHLSFSGIEVLRELNRRKKSQTIFPVVYTSTIGTIDNREEYGYLYNEQIQIKHGLSRTPQVWIDCHVIDEGKCLKINWDVREHIFNEHVIRKMLSAFQTLLKEMGTSEKVWEEKNPIKCDGESINIRERKNATDKKYVPHMLYEGFLKQITERSENIAIIHDHQKYSYRDLEGYVGGIQKRLLEMGVGHGDYVAIIMPRSALQIASVLAVSLLGGIFVPLDYEQPIARQKNILRNLNPKVILLNSENKELQGDCVANTINLLQDNLEKQKIYVNSDNKVSDYAYVIYTSGTTGQPKGVVMSHKAVANTIDGINERFCVNNGSTFLGLSKLAFDLSIYDIFGCFDVGGTLVLPNETKAKNPEHWIELVELYNIQIWNSVPALFKMYLDTMKEENKIQKMQKTSMSKYIHKYNETENAPVKVISFFHAGTGRLIDYKHMVENLLDKDMSDTKLIGFTYGEYQQYMETPVESLVQDRANLYAETLLEFNVDRYTLVGYCVGGFLALETAKILLENGKKVKLIMIDSRLCQHTISNQLLMEYAYGLSMELDMDNTPYSIKPVMLKEALEKILNGENRNIKNSELTKLSDEYAELGEVFTNLLDMTHEERIKALFNSKKQHNFNGEESTISMLNLLYDIYEHTFNAMMRYRPEGIYSGDITYINATEGIVNFYPDTNVATTWEDMVLGEFKIVNIYANHASIVGAEHSKEILPYIE